MASATLAPISGASPIGSRFLDLGWTAGIAAALAYTASTAKRGPLLIAATLAVASSRTLTAVLIALLAVGFAAMSTVHLLRRAPLMRGLAGGATAISLLTSSMERVGWATAVVAVGICAPILISGRRNAERPARSALAWTAAAGLVFGVVAAAAAGFGVVENARKLDRGTVALEQGLAAARAGDAATAAERLQAAQILLSSAREGIDRWGWPARAVPFVAQHVSAVTAILGDVEAAADQAGRTAFLASGDTLAVRAGGIDVHAVSELEHPFRRLANLLAEVVREVDERASGPILPALRDRLGRLGTEASEAQRQAANTSKAAAAVPDMLGSDRPHRYLVLFTSPAEARGRFGFPGSFAEITMTDGRLVLGEHGAMSAVFRDLDPDQRAFEVDDDQLRPYLSYAPTRTMLSVTIPPDFPTVARLAAELWAQSGRDPVDGVLRFDPSALALLLNFTGPIDVRNIPAPLTPANLEQFLLFDQYVQFPESQAPRRELLETVSEVTFERLQSANLPTPRVLVDLFAPLVLQGHLEVVAFDEDAGDFLDQMGLQGRFAPPPGDGLLVTNVNITGNKIDTFLTRKVNYSARVEDGDLEGIVTVELHNGAPPGNLPFYVIGSSTRPVLPLGTNRTALLVYTAVPATEVLVDGVLTPVLSTQTAGRWVHQVVVELPPRSTRTVQVRLAGPLGDGPYQLRLEPSVGSTPDQYSVDVEIADRRPMTFRGRLTTPTDLR